MQGKERNMTKIDNHFRDHSWSEMRRILDKELPQTQSREKGKKRYLPLLAFLLVGFVSGVGTMLYFSQLPAPKLPEVEKTKTEIAVISKPEIAPQKPRANSNYLNNLEESTVENSVFKKVNAKAVAKNTNPIFELQTGKNPLTTVFFNENTDQSEVESTLNENDFVGENPVSTKNSPDLLQLQVLALEKINSKSIAPESLQSNEKFDLIEIPKDKKWAFATTLGTYANTNSIFAGMTLGGKATFKLDRRFVIGGGLQYSILSGYKKSGVFSSAEDMAVDPNNYNDTTATENFAGAFDQYVQTQPGIKNLPISNLHYIEMPLEIAYRFSGKFQIHLGVKTGYLVVANADEMLREANNRLSADRPVDADLYNGLEKIDFATTIGLGFYPTKNFGIDLQYNHGMVDITKDEVWLQNKANPNRNIQLSATYFFGKQ